MEMRKACAISFCNITTTVIWDLAVQELQQQQLEMLYGRLPSSFTVRCAKKSADRSQRIHVEYFKSFMTKVCAQKICEARIFLDCKNVRAFKMSLVNAPIQPNLDHESSA